jgi:hypothetical protein
MLRHLLFYLFLKGGQRMCAIHGRSQKVFFTPVRIAGKCCFLGLIGLPLFFGWSACSRSSEKQAPGHLREKSQGVGLTCRVVPHPVQGWIESIGKVRTGKTVQEKILDFQVQEPRQEVKLTSGRKIEFKADRFPEKRFQGTIISVQETKDSSGISASIRVTTGQEMFSPDDFLLIRILQEEKSILAVPKTALLLKEGRFYVYLVAAGRTKLKEIKPLFAGSELPLFTVSNNLVAIEGLNEGDEVLLEAIWEDSA